mgnify:CR=1 FL=1
MKEGITDKPLLDFEGPYAARMVNNLDWTAGLSAIEFLRDAFGFRVATVVPGEDDRQVVHAELRWVAKADFPKYAFPTANRKFLDLV